MKFINKYQSSNFNKRKSGSSIKYIIIHYTAIEDYFEAIQHLCSKDNKVSCHFLINKKGAIYYLVNTKNRAWHAGQSYWNKDTDINSESIGIEMVNSGHHILFESYNLNQIKALIKLLQYLVNKYKIDPINILGHSDIAPYRKIDPGQKFPWKKISKNNIVFKLKKLSNKKKDELDYFLYKKFKNSQKKKVLFILKSIGYNIKPATKSDKKYIILIKAYQMHFRQKNVSGKIDRETYKILLSHYNQILT
ncbi:MAG: N-acetylmuramoyl-L-alanine amidase AmiD [Alphaproteobacteria bacterium MarineAlpha5_Bin8]|nr:MAG: N-acetylmuramoyl-L-alanine amidase AmiD [Alphaproteobacteria bacterium MarineAlpha5_Bin8]PPR45375.1 MAG: N-acetylmuramoyl-L-alanine amidase AmiD [Alphaproteobacteria bacterium MarineAlpha5_Bin7]PPR52849.1 MAG: N-acetylmuramoyl-L-alanine amidase AmiD [Alphaproteobacteria bacterium MarineAlpha5_Bin6]|tara:strand:+ start:2209 stop:2955 length:747 start_codon:yes stop_codon:yes gene_type:complete